MNKFVLHLLLFPADVLLSDRGGHLPFSWIDVSASSDSVTNLSIKNERFTGVAENVFTSPAQQLRNPLVLYVQAFNWSRDLAAEKQ